MRDYGRNISEYRHPGSSPRCVYIYIYLKCILATNKNKLHNVRRCLFNKLCEYRRFAVPCWIESQGGSINGEIFFFFLEIENFFFESKGSFITIDRRMELKNLWRIYSIINQRPIQGFCIGSLKEAIWKDSMNGTSMKNINIEWKKRKKVK